MRSRRDMLMNAQEESRSTHIRMQSLHAGRPIAIQVREFGAVVALVLSIIAGWLAYKGAVPSTTFSLIVTGIIVWSVGVVRPHLLYSAWSSWMALAGVLSVIMTFLILGILWLFVLVPTSLILRLIHKQVMDLSFRAPVESYWLTPSPGRDDFKRMERQY